MSLVCFFYCDNGLPLYHKKYWMNSYIVYQPFDQINKNSSLYSEIKCVWKVYQVDWGLFDVILIIKIYTLPALWWLWSVICHGKCFNKRLISVIVYEYVTMTYTSYLYEYIHVDIFYLQFSPLFFCFFFFVLFLISK